MQQTCVISLAHLHYYGAAVFHYSQDVRVLAVNAYLPSGVNSSTNTLANGNINLLDNNNNKFTARLPVESQLFTYVHIRHIRVGGLHGSHVNISWFGSQYWAQSAAYIVAARLTDEVILYIMGQ